MPKCGQTVEQSNLFARSRYKVAATVRRPHATGAAHQEKALSTTEPAAIDPTADDLADAIEDVAQARHDAAVAELGTASMSALDASLMRGNPRQRHGDQTVWNVIDVMHTPLMAFDPAQISSLPEYVELDGYGVSMGVDAMKAMYDTVGQVIEARETLKANEVRHPAELALELDSFLTKLMPVATGKLDSAVATISKAIKFHEGKQREQIKDSASGAEVRSFVRSLPIGERRKVLQHAIESGDAVTVGALLGSPTRILTGLELTDEMHTAYLRQWNAKRDPDTAKKLALAQGAVAKLEAAGSAYLNNMERIIGVSLKTLGVLRAKRDKVRKALA